MSANLIFGSIPALGANKHETSVSFMGAGVFYWERYRSVNEDILPEERLTMIGAGYLLGYTVFKEMWPDIRLLFTNA